MSEQIAIDFMRTARNPAPAEPPPRLVFPAGSQPVETSEAAADALSADELNARRLRVLKVFAVRGKHGATADEIVAACGTGRTGDHNKWAPRVTELLQAGYLDRLDGKQGRDHSRRVTRQGGTAFVHVINARGWAEVDNRV